MSLNRRLKELKKEDIVDSFVLPHRLKKTLKDKADNELEVELDKKRTLINDTVKAKLNALQLKFQLENSIRN